MTSKCSMKHELNIGDLIVSRDTGKPCLIVGVRDGRQNEYGNLGRNRKVYRIFGDGREYWLHDIEVRAKFIINP